MMDCISQKRATDLWVRSLRRDWLRFCPHRLLGAVKLQGPGKEKKREQDGTKRRGSHRVVRRHDFTGIHVIWVSDVDVTEAF